MLTEKWRLAREEDTLVLAQRTSKLFRAKPGARWAPHTGYFVIRSLPDGHGLFLGLSGKRAMASSFTQASCYSWSSKGLASTPVWQKIRTSHPISALHFLQPPVIGKEHESNANMYANQKAWREGVKKKAHIFRQEQFSLKCRYVGVFYFVLFWAPFSTIFRWRIFLKQTGID